MSEPNTGSLKRLTNLLTLRGGGSEPWKTNKLWKNTNSNRNKRGTPQILQALNKQIVQGYF